MTEKKVTIQSLLTEDKRKRLAELLLNNEIEDMVVIYHKDNIFQCDSSCEDATAATVGMLDMAKTLIMDDWLHPERYHPEISKDDDRDSEEDGESTN